MKFKLAIIEIPMGIYELIFNNDKRRLWQVCHYIKRGSLIIATMGKLVIPKIDYYKDE